MFRPRTGRRFKPGARGHGYLPTLMNVGADVRRQTGVDTFLTVARCPRCQTALTARLGPRGPYFHCACTPPR